jgi:hypothetical protein
VFCFAFLCAWTGAQLAAKFGHNPHLSPRLNGYYILCSVIIVTRSGVRVLRLKGTFNVVEPAGMPMGLLLHSLRQDKYLG